MTTPSQMWERHRKARNLSLILSLLILLARGHWHYSQGAPIGSADWLLMLAFLSTFWFMWLSRRNCRNFYQSYWAGMPELYWLQTIAREERADTLKALEQELRKK